MGPARCFLNRVGRIGLVVEPIKTGVAVGLENAAKVLQMSSRMLALAIRGVGKPHRRRIQAAGGP
jgi:hypothetical protein